MVISLLILRLFGIWRLKMLLLWGL